MSVIAYKNIVRRDRRGGGQGGARRTWTTRRPCGVACWEGILPKHACSPGQPVGACLPLTWEVKGPQGPGKRQEGAGSREIWGFPLSSLHPSLPEDVVHSAPPPSPHTPPTRQDQVSGTALTVVWSVGVASPLQPPPRPPPPFLPSVPHPRGSPSSWVMLPRPAQRPAPPPTVLASLFGGCSLFGSRTARLLVGAGEQMLCQSPATMCARSQQLWDPNTRARSGCGIRWGG
ncbi:uncharacterized protein [Kogia breviceps]|uniref:uncharacterized protein n=1 Tax=Kogia breviceps TaxID=27615 RepID=UPI0034D3742B